MNSSHDLSLKQQIRRNKILERIDKRMNDYDEPFDYARNIKYCSICEKPYWEKENEHWTLYHGKLSNEQQMGDTVP